MNVSPEERLQDVWSKLLIPEQETVVHFAEFLAQRRDPRIVPEESLSEEAHARIVAALDAVAARSQETGRTVSNRNHDADLYGEP